MAKVEQIKTAVRYDQFLAVFTQSLAPLRQVVPRNDFIAEIHQVILTQTISAWQRFYSGSGRISRQPLRVEVLGQINFLNERSRQITVSGS